MLNFDKRTEEGKTILYLKQEINTSNAAEFRELLKSVNDTDILLDFREVEYISSAGLRILLEYQNYADNAGKRLEICHINELVKEIFESTGFDRFLAII